MTIVERFVGDVTILDIYGRVTSDEGAHPLGASIRHLLHRGRRDVLMNLEAVPYIDSTALGEIVRSYTTALQMGGAVKLLHVGERIRVLLATTKLMHLMPMFEVEGDAIASFDSAHT
jgi:anti-anti-sigma factor